jgi:hypothetical protein
MPAVTYTNSIPGTIVDCFPLTSSLSNWSTAKVRLTESPTGLWTGTLTAGNWAVFEGGSQPADFSLSVGTMNVAATPTTPTPPPNTINLTGSLAQRIDAAVKSAATANEADDFALAAKRMRTAVMLMMGHPRIKIEEDETEYVHDDLVAAMKEFERMAKEQQRKTAQAGGGFACIPIRTRQN